MTVLRLDQIIVERRHRKDLGDIASLAHSIDKLGLLHPIVVTIDHRLVAGERRLAAVRSLGWDMVDVTVAGCLTDAADMLEAERDENTQRLAMKPTEETSLYQALLEIERADAKRRQEEAAAAGNRARLQKVSATDIPAVAKPRRPEAKALAATAATGVPGRAKTLDKVIEVKAIAESPATPPPVAKVAELALAEMDATGRVDGAYQRVKLAEQIDAAPKPDPRVTEYLDNDPELQASKFRVAFATAISKSNGWLAFPADRVAEVCDDTAIRSIELHAEAAANYLDKVRRARSGLRLVAGGRK